MFDKYQYFLNIFTYGAPYYISLSHIPHLTPSHTTPHTHTPHSFVWRSNREQGVTREKQLPQKLHRLLPMATTKKQQDLRRRPHILPGGLRKNLTPSHKQWCMCTRGATGRPSCEETGVVCQISSDSCVLPSILYASIKLSIITHIYTIVQWCFVHCFSFGSG